MSLLTIIPIVTVLSASALASNHKDNLEILKSIPLVKGWEKKDSGEDKIAKKLAEIFEKIANEGKNTDGSINRGTHAKGICLNGEVSLFSEAELESEFSYSTSFIKRIKQGFFKNEGTFPAEFRFSNGKGERNPDTTNDVRAISFSIDTKNLIQDASGSDRLDFMMNSTPMFAVNNIKEFYELMKTARLAMGDYSYVINPLYLKSTLNAKKLLDLYERNDAKSYATEEYWANLPYVHGIKNNEPNEIVKYKVTPCDGLGRQSESSEGKSDTYLQDDLLERVKNNQVCFYLQVQLFDHEKLKNSLGGKHKKWSKSDWIENGGELWEESVLPFYTIAKIEVASHLNSKQVSCENKSLNTRLHSSPEHLPIGSIARVRTYVEEKSRAKRQSN